MTLNSKTFHQPAEWEKHSAVWTAWPSHADLWQENLPGAQSDFLGLVRAIADLDPATGKARGEKLKILVPTDEALSEAKAAFGNIPAEFFRIPFGDIWLRDTAPVFTKNEKGEISSTRFGFNGWGGKYVLDHDTEVSGRVAEAAKREVRSFSFVLEGGSVEVDGQGTAITTRECLLNANRGSDGTEESSETALLASLGVSKVIWLERGLTNDHTDGHIDNLARFVAPGRVVCMEARSSDDPNRAVLEEIAETLCAATDAHGKRLEVIRLPSPGKIVDETGRVMAASYMNFYIANTTVVVPTYGTPFDAEAIEILKREFPSRRVVGSSSKSILSGGGSFHCITQQEPV